MYPQSMFWNKNKKKYVYPCISQFYYIKVGFMGVFIARSCFPDVKDHWYNSANRLLYGGYLMNTLLGIVYF